MPGTDGRKKTKPDPDLHQAHSLLGREKLPRTHVGAGPHTEWGQEEPVPPATLGKTSQRMKGTVSKEGNSEYKDGVWNSSWGMMACCGQAVSAEVGKRAQGEAGHGDRGRLVDNLGHRGSLEGF